MKFKINTWRERHAQSFDKSKITLTKAGNTYNVYDKIQEAREDTEIYPTLEKYGCIDRLKLAGEPLYQDFTELQKLGDARNILEFQKKAENMFYSMPTEDRSVFNNSIQQFVEKGESWLKEKIEKAKQNEPEAPTTQTEEKGEVNNG